MKKMQKRLMTSLCVVLLLISSSSLIFATETNNDGLKMDSQDSAIQLNRDVAKIQEALEREGITIESGLNDQIQLYRNEMKKVTDGQSKEKLQFLIDATIDLLNEYKEAINSSDANGKAAKVDAGYAVAVAAIDTWFNAQGYYLSSECLLYARDNTKLDSTKTPYWVYRVQGTKKFSELKNSTKLSGSDTFSNSGDAVDKDMYYTIHAFSWTKPSARGQVTINDRYDFAKNDRYSGLAQTAVNVMYLAQEAGYLTPFKIKATY